ncbi:MAG: hypothetical protein ABI852_16830 [Gemmatimonadaceae bacterium]
MSQSILTVMLCSFDNSAAATSAPLRPERNTGFVLLLAIIAMVKVFPPPAAAIAVPLSPAALSPLAHAKSVAATATTASGLNEICERITAPEKVTGGTA